MSRERVRRGVLPPSEETIKKLKEAIDAGNFYGAQQMYKSFSARYTASKKYNEALNILQSGASLQLEHGQITCGAELSLLFVETLVKGETVCNEKNLDRIRKIYKNFPKISTPQQPEDDEAIQKISEAIMEAKTRVEGCSSFLKAAIKWSAEFGDHKYGSPELYSMLAEYIYSESPELDMVKLSVYFIRADNPRNLASTLVDFMSKCYPSEDDLTIARVVLMYLSQGNLRDANCLMDELKKQVESNQLDFPQSELIQFIVYLLLTLERDALPLFRILRQKYKSSIERDASFEEFLDEIGEKFYGVQRKSGIQGIFGDLFKMMTSEI
ncbi:Golgi to ER traffic protein 4 [Zostera marina]|uniref:Golgi to ER traffic protein 4 n=1 Tax=Zostera marina TaxID=29655 RepID=A0A0K9PXW3_ZOSMR|nr:Golgi to ER traffic protein 4 [Zostera marina]